MRWNDLCNNSALKAFNTWKLWTCKIGVNKINNVFIDNFSLQTVIGQPFDLFLDRVAEKNR